MVAKKLLVLVAVLGVAGVVSALAADDVESTVETALGVGGVSTYLDFAKYSDTREGLTMTVSTAVDSWSLDGSNSAMSVNGNSLDDKDKFGGDDFEITITGLSANTSYGVFILAKGVATSTNPYADFSWGLASDGSAVNLVEGVALIEGAILCATQSADGNFAVPLAQIMSDASGTLSLWAGCGTPYNYGDNEYSRTQIDGIVLGEMPIPEPATMVLLGLGGLALIRRKR